MARYTGSKSKVNRRFGVPVYGSTKSLERKNYRPGVHGPRGSRRKQSDYAVALAEKQKLRHQYGLLERQFRRCFEIALRRRGVTGQILLEILETRLDNVVYRLGFARSRRGARQLVGHGHVRINGRKVDIPSFNVRVGDRITIADKAKSKRLAQRSQEEMQIPATPDWLNVDREKLVGQVMRTPTRDEIQPIANEQLVVELYSR